MSTLVLAVALLVVGLAAHRLAGSLRPLTNPSTTPSIPRTVPSADEVSVVVPARDEEATLPTLLDTLARLSPAPGEVVVVDDESRDATAAVARAGGARVVATTGPPPGWTGKAWACHRGAEETSGELLLFLDADTALGPDALAALLARHEEHGGLVSVQPFHAVHRPYEQLSAYFNVVSLLASAAFGPRRERHAMAFGPCLLTSRADYRRAGGHEAVRGQVLDDVRLAAAYHRAGLPVRCFTGGSALRFRMYPDGLRQLAEGWSKNIASGASAAAPGPTAVVVAWLVAHHAVAVGLLLALVGLVVAPVADLSTGSPVLWALAWVALALQLRWLLRRLGAFSWWTWALFPMPLLAFDLLFARSVVLTAGRGSVRWRGRDVDLRGSRSPEEP